jgi:fluoride ion exporter CrcB/FEX
MEPDTTGSAIESGPVDHYGGGWPWATWGINVSGYLLIGVLMVLFASATRDVQRMDVHNHAGPGLAQTRKQPCCYTVRRCD